MARGPRRPPSDFPDVLEITPRQRRQFFWLIAGVVILVLFFASAGTIATFYLDQLWFDNLGFRERFWSEINFRAVIVLVAGLGAALPLWFTVDWLRRAMPDAAPEIEVFEPGEEPTTLGSRLLAAQLAVVRLALNLGRWVVAGIGGGLTALAINSQWETVMLWRYGQPMGQTDAVYGRDLSYYLFTFPFEQLAVGAGLTVVFLAVVVLVVLSIWARLPELALRHLGGATVGLGLMQLRLLRLWGIWLAVGFTLLAWRHLLVRINLLYTEHSAFTGIDYIGDHWWRYAEYGLAGFALLVALIALAVALAPRLGTLRRIGLMALVSYGVVIVLALAIGGIYWALRVRPNELDSERPYISLSIVGTREAFGLVKFHEQEFTSTGKDREALVAQRDVLNDVRLWDWRALKASLEQQQALRPYYQFPDIDVDRYRVGDQVRSVMISAREMSTKDLPANARTWTNEHFIYTHGYGVTMNSVNAFSIDGGPELILKDMPVNSTTPTIKVTRPEIYFGELTTNHVYVRTTQKEFDYPVGQETAGPAMVTTTYEGKGGIPVHTWGTRLAAAIALGDGFQILLSNYLTPESQVLFRRQVAERVRTVAPFLLLDPDTYVVVTDEGRIQFVIDAYTTSDKYPQAAATRWRGERLSYIRNTVKAVVDAYDGSVRLYIVDETDPLIRAYRQFYPGLFQSGEMPADLRAHLRYPEGLMQIQANVYSLFHMTDPQVFYNREDIWQIARQVRNVEDGNNSEVEMTPYFIQAPLVPGGEQDFILILPFTPSKRNNLVAWMAAGSNPGNYGEVYVYRFPKGRLTDGPLQFEARIDQDPQLSPQLTLWNQQGSRVLRGDTIALPVAGQMIYIEPIYLKAQHSPMPELRLVVIGRDNDLFYGTTFDEAFAKLGGGRATATPPTQTAEGQPPAPAPAPGQAPAQPSAQPPPGTPAVPPDLKALARSAADRLRNYQRATAEGRYVDAGRELDALKSDLEKMNQLSGRP